MNLKRLFPALLITFLYLLFPSETFAFSCAIFNPSVYLKCDDSYCQGFKEFVPICYWVSEVEDLPPQQLNSFQNYIQARKGQGKFKGVWELKISESCYSVIDSVIEVESACTEHLKNIEVIDLDEEGVTFAKARSIAESRAFQDRAARAFSIFFQALFIIGLGSITYIILVVRYILHEETNLRILIGAWPAILVGICLLSWGIFFKYLLAVEIILVITVILFLLGRGMLIGNWISTKARMFNKSQPS